MTLPKPNLLEVLYSLENLYGPQKAAGPTDPYEMIVYVNSGYPAADLPCSRGFEALKREVGLKPENILEAPKTKLTKLMRLGGIVPELRAEKLKDIARMVKADLGGDLKAVLNKWLLEEKKQPGKGIHGAKNVLQKFPVIGEPGADKILLFSKLAAVVAVPLKKVGVPMRLWFGETGKNYAADYRVAREILSAGLDETFEARQRAYLLLKETWTRDLQTVDTQVRDLPANGAVRVLSGQGRG